MNYCFILLNVFSKNKSFSVIVFNKIFSYITFNRQSIQIKVVFALYIFYIYYLNLCNEYNIYTIYYIYICTICSDVFILKLKLLVKNYVFCYYQPLIGTSFFNAYISWYFYEKIWSIFVYTFLCFYLELYVFVLYCHHIN